MQIRDAVEADFEAITAKYNDVLTNSTAIYNDRPATVEDRIAWWRTRLEQHFPVLVQWRASVSADSAVTATSVPGPAIGTPSKAQSMSRQASAATALARFCSKRSSCKPGRPASTP